MSMEIKWDEAPDGYPIWIGNDYSIGDWFREQHEYYENREGFIWGKDHERSGRIIVHRRPEPVAWDGVGRPPVGADCQYKIDGKWEQARIVAHDGNATVISVGALYHGSWYGDKTNPNILPIPTPEQKAAQERERAIEKMCRIAGLSCTLEEFSEKLYDAGLRFTGGES